jgi:hypothetical protein
MDHPSEPNSPNQYFGFILAGLFLVIAILVLFPIVLIPPLDSNGLESGTVQINVFGFVTNWIAWLAVLSVVSGMIGAYIEIARNIFEADVSTRNAVGRVARAGSLFLDLLVGGLSGFLGGLLLPTALLRTGNNLHAFNPAALAILSSTIGFTARQMLASVIDRIEQALASTRPEPLAPEVVEASFRRVLTAPPLVAYKGHLTCVVNADGKSCMDGEVAHLNSASNEYQLEVRLEPTPRPSSASIEVAVDGSETSDNIDLPNEAPFTIEVSADGLDVVDRKAEINARTGRRSNAVFLRLRRPHVDAFLGESTIRLVLSQASQMMQVLVVAVKGP